MKGCGGREIATRHGPCLGVTGVIHVSSPELVLTRGLSGCGQLCTEADSGTDKIYSTQDVKP